MADLTVLAAALLGVSLLAAAVPLVAALLPESDE